MKDSERIIKHLEAGEHVLVQYKDGDYAVILPVFGSDGWFSRYCNEDEQEAMIEGCGRSWSGEEIKGADPKFIRSWYKAPPVLEMGTKVRLVDNGSIGVINGVHELSGGGKYEIKIGRTQSSYYRHEFTVVTDGEEELDGFKEKLSKVLDRKAEARSALVDSLEEIIEALRKENII